MDVPAARLEPGFDGVEALRELVIGGGQRPFRLDAEFSRQVGDGEQQVTHFFRRPRRCFIEGLAQLLDFLLDFREHVPGGRPIEPHRRHARADLVRAQQCGQRTRHARQDTWGIAGIALFGGFESCPLFAHGVGRRRLVPRPLTRREPASVRREDVRMAPNQFVGNRVDHIADPEAAGFGGQLRMEHTLKEDVAQLSAEVVQVAGIDGVDRFVGLLEQVPAQRGVCLLPVPRTPVRPTQRSHDGHQPIEGRTCGGTTAGRARGGLRPCRHARTS